MTVVHFVRHARKARESSFDPSISPKGQREAQTTARAFERDAPTAIYTSPLRRAQDTAHIIAQKYGLVLTVSSLLRERMNWGDLPGQSFEEFVADWEHCSADRFYKPLVGDSSVEAGKRLELFLHEATQNSHGPIVAVTHGGIIADLLLNLCTEQYMRSLNPAFAASPYSGEVVRECSITSVQLEPGLRQVLRIADCSHLPER